MEQESMSKVWCFSQKCPGLLLIALVSHFFHCSLLAGPCASLGFRVLSGFLNVVVNNSTF